MNIELSGQFISTVAGGAAIGVAVAWIHHRLKRRFQNRCSQCGKPTRVIAHYMCEKENPPYKPSPRIELLHGIYHETATFRRCHGGHLRAKSDDRYVSLPALLWRSLLAPHQFDFRNVAALYAEAGWDRPGRVLIPSRSCTTKNLPLAADAPQIPQTQTLTMPAGKPAFHRETLA